MNVSDLLASKFLGKNDVPHPVVATISSVKLETIKGRSGNEQKTIMGFLDIAKPMIVNKGNIKTLAKLFSMDTDAWVGKKIEIFVNPNVEYEGEMVGGLRLREPSKNGTPASYHETPLNSVWTFEQAVAEVAKVGITKDQLVEALKKEGSSKWKADRDTPLVKRFIETMQQEEIPFG